MSEKKGVESLKYTLQSSVIGGKRPPLFTLEQSWKPISWSFLPCPLISLDVRKTGQKWFSRGRKQQTEMTVLLVETRTHCRWICFFYISCLRFTTTLRRPILRKFISTRWNLGHYHPVSPSSPTREHFAFIEKKCNAYSEWYPCWVTPCGYYAAGQPLSTGPGRQRGSL